VEVAIGEDEAIGEYRPPRQATAYVFIH